MGAAGKGGIYRPREEGESLMNTTPAPVPRPTLDKEDRGQSWRDWGSYRAISISAWEPSKAQERDRATFTYGFCAIARFWPIIRPDAPVIRCFCAPLEPPVSAKMSEHPYLVSGVIGGCAQLAIIGKHTGH